LGKETVVSIYFPGGLNDPSIPVFENTKLEKPDAGEKKQADYKQADSKPVVGKPSGKKASG
jgi:hypothetical protein